jgi:hypothetical protein
MESFGVMGLDCMLEGFFYTDLTAFGVIEWSSSPFIFGLANDIRLLCFSFMYNILFRFLTCVLLTLDSS